MVQYEYQDQINVTAALDQSDYRVWFIAPITGGNDQWYSVTGTGKRMGDSQIVSLAFEPYQRDWQMTVRQLQALVDKGVYRCVLEVPECNHAGPHDPCAGKVRWIMSDSGLSAWPYCEKHAAARETVLARAREYSSPVRASWFDEANAGERWDEDE
jgi:hypothetical protein